MSTQNLNETQRETMIEEPAVVIDEEALYEAEEPSEREAYMTSFFQEAFEGGAAAGAELTVFFNEHMMLAERLTAETTFTVGDATDNAMMLAHPSVGARFALVERLGEHQMLRVAAGMGGQVLLGDEVVELEEAIAMGVLRPLADGCHGLMLGRGAAARVDVGETSFFVRRAVASQEVLPRAAWRPDLRFGAFVTGSVALHALFIFLALYTPPEARAFNLDGLDGRDRFIAQVIKAQQEEREREAPIVAGAQGNEASDEVADGARGEVGKAGRPDAKDVPRRAATQGPKDNPVPEFERDRQIVARTGVFSVLDQGLARTWTTEAPILGADPVTALADNSGTQIGDGLGDFALGDRRGPGPGAGGLNERSFQAPTMTTSKRCCGPDSGPPGIDRDAMLTEPKRELLPDVIPQNPKILGSLDKQLVQQVIRKHRNEIKYCYEQGLTRHRDLSGRVVVKFTIGGNGAVASAFIENSTLGNRDVEACVAGKVRRWVFPEPKGNGLVVVSYPFRFAPQGR